MTPTKKTAKRPMSLGLRNTLVGISFILPNFIGFFVFILIPICFSFVLGVHQWDGYNEMEFVGLDNFRYLFGNKGFLEALWRTVGYTLSTVAITFVASLALAVLINQKLKGIGLFRTAIFFPYVASVVAVGAVWQMLFQKDFGLINEFLRMLGVTDVPGWFATTKWALPAVVIVTVWKNMGYYMIVFLAALQNVPTELIEAGKIDGASAWRRFWSIKFPMIAPATFFVLMMLTINSFKSFDLIYVLTEGGPGTATTLISNFIYNQAFVSWNYGNSSAAAIVLFAVVGTLTVVQLQLEKKFTNF